MKAAERKFAFRGKSRTYAFGNNERVSRTMLTSKCVRMYIRKRREMELPGKKVLCNELRLINFYRALVSRSLAAIVTTESCRRQLLFRLINFIIASSAYMYARRCAWRYKISIVSYLERIV